MENNQLKNVPATFSEAFWFWLKLGFISFGGPAGQIATMHQELVEKRRWISEERFLHALNYCMVLPGPEAQQLATYLGWLMHRSLGGIVAGTLFILPSLFILIGLSWIYITLGHTTTINSVFGMIKPAVVAIVLHAAHRIGTKTLKNQTLWMVAIASFIAIFLFNLPFPVIVLGAGLTGYFFNKKEIGFTKYEGEANDSSFNKSTLLIYLAIGLLLWLLPISFLFFTYGWQHSYTQMSWFFTKAALLTFGGAYSVLPYVYQMAVDHYHWLSSAQMLDGLALGETTPGPLIMVVAFVGFIGGYSKELMGSDQLLIAGITGAVIATWFTFLPSFLFILLGAPWIEATRNNLKFSGPLSAITAAVVGVIINLAIFFSYHVFWPRGINQEIDLLAISVSTFTSLLLFKMKWSILRIMILCTILGIIKSLI